MGRTPCCEKMGLKKGPWTLEEDQILINYISQHGHNNWRALPKQAGLLRCGKSCRLRWTNYLRPDIKRGNFSQDEEETIINLHEQLGNRWSAIAARLPGRTDNEIKNVWHTHLKKRLPSQQNQPSNGATISTATTMTTNSTGPTKKIRSRRPRAVKEGVVPKKTDLKHEKCVLQNDTNHNNSTNSSVMSRPTTIVIKNEPISLQPSTSEVSTVTSTSASENDNISKENVKENIGDFPAINDDFWMEVLSIEDTAMSTEDLPSISPSNSNTLHDDLWPLDPMFENKSSVHSEEMDVFWYNLLSKTTDIPELTNIL